DRNGWSRAINALLASQAARDNQRELQELVESLRGLRSTAKAHPVLHALEEAARARDVAAWRAAWEERERIREDKVRLARYDDLLDRLDRSCAGLGRFIRGTSGVEDWNQRVRRLREAWHWGAARGWLRRISDTEKHEARIADYHRLKRRIEQVTEDLASQRAWKAFFDRLNERTIQDLNAWKKAVDRIGRGTGLHANRHRRTARKYLMECVP